MKGMQETVNSIQASLMTSVGLIQGKNLYDMFSLIQTYLYCNVIKARLKLLEAALY